VKFYVTDIQVISRNMKTFLMS